jgi:hypothetical protein
MTLHIRSCELAIDDPRADVRVARRHQIETRDALVNDTRCDPLPWKRGVNLNRTTSKEM